MQCKILALGLAVGSVIANPTLLKRQQDDSNKGQQVQLPPEKKENSTSASDTYLLGDKKGLPQTVAHLPAPASQEEADASGAKPEGSSKVYNEKLPLPDYKYPRYSDDPGVDIQQPGWWKRICQPDGKLAPAALDLQAPIHYFEKLPNENNTKEVNLYPGSCLTKYPNTPEQEKDNVRVSICSPPDGMLNLALENVAVFAAVKDLADNCKGEYIGGISQLLSSSARTNNLYALVDRLDTPAAPPPTST
ncbi:MAG: hypothetical protein M1831_003820 [Alyxoria varia]|nr:MAG: hypothetical protein M1831_003820 [Alyxoria varia]